MTTTNPGARGGRPFVRGAFFCETVVEGKDGTNTYVRTIDRFTVQAQIIASGAPPPGTPIPSLPDSLPESTFTGVFVVMLVGAGARGRVSLTVEIETPDGLRQSFAGPIDLPFDGREHQGVNVHMSMRLQVRNEGIHWMHVQLDGVTVTQSPIEVAYQRGVSMR